MAERVAELADEAAAAGHFLSAAEKYGRATAYYVTAERMQSRHYEPRKKAYRTMLTTMERMVFAGGLNCGEPRSPTATQAFPACWSRATAPARVRAWYSVTGWIASKR